MNKLKTYAYRRLAARPEHSFTLRKSLLEKGATAAEANTISNDLVSLGYLDDSAFLAGFLESSAKKGQGVRVIRHKLRLKGIPQDEVDAAFANTPIDAKEQIERLLATKLRNREPRKQIAALIRRGFSYGDIEAAGPSQFEE